jgi:capsid protein
LCQPVYEAVLLNAVLRGRIEAPGFVDDPILRMAWCRTRWTGPSPGQIDPLKEVNAAEKRIALRLSSRTRETAELTGEDWESVAAELQTEDALIDELGLSADPVAPEQPPAEPEGSMDQPEAA